MIKSNELRIGNLATGSESNNYFRLTSEMIRHIDKGLAVVNPIPLTPEILEQCGFEKDIIDHPVPNHEAFGFYKFHVKIYWTKQIKVWYKGSPIDIVVKYLHQLQNLHFALTGEELEITL